jgi:TPR repeat protein
MFELRVGLLLGALVMAGCQAKSRSVATDPAVPSAPKPVAAPVPEEAAPELGAPAQAPGECASGEACSAAASDEERQRHPERAAPLYARACDLGLGQACHRLGELYRDGKGVAPDDDRARALFEQGCRQGSNAACDALGH